MKHSQAVKPLTRLEVLINTCCFISMFVMGYTAIILAEVLST